MSTGIIFALITTVSWAVGIFPFTEAARKLGVNSLNHFRLILACVFITIIAFILAPDQLTHIFSSEYLSAWFWLGLSGIVGLTIGDHYGFAMYRILGARVGSILTTFAPAAALIMGSVLIDERISFIGIIGIVFTIIGVNFISLGKKERSTIPDHGHGSITKGIIYGIIAALCQGAGLVLAKKGLMTEKSAGHELAPVCATFIRLSIGTLSLYVLTTITGGWKKVIQPLIENKDGGIKNAISGTVFGPTFGVLLSLYTVSFLEPSVAQTIFSLVPAVAMLLAFIRYKEKISFASATGMIIAIGGVIILIWRNAIEQMFS